MINDKYHQDIVELSPTAIVVYSAKNKKILFANPAACKILKYEKYEDVIGLSSIDFVHPEYQDVVKKRIEIMIETNTIAEPMIEKFITSNKEEIMVEVTAKPITYKDNPSILVMFNDVSDEVNLEEQLRQSAKLEAVGQLAGGVAHDFNNILTIIGGHAELLMNKIIKLDNTTMPKEVKELCEYAKNKLKKITNASLRAEKLTNQLLAFSRKQIMKPEVINLNKFVIKEKDLLRKLIREDIEIVLIVDPSVENIFIDETQLSLIFMNLIINSKDAIQETGKIIIETKNVSFDKKDKKNKKDLMKEGDYVMVAITDDGIGMNKEIQKRIFEPFFTTKDTGKGAGLGLSTVYGIVKQSSGFIWVYSELGIGTTFKVYFPKIGDKQKNNTFNYKQIESKTFTGTETLLVVEDEKDVRDLISETLRDLGYKVLVATNGVDAIEITKTYGKNIDMLLTDVVMPKMDGRELAISLSKFLPNIKVLYMSGYTDNTIVHHGILDPGTNFIQKPTSPKVLAEKIRIVLDNGT